MKISFMPDFRMTSTFMLFWSVKKDAYIPSGPMSKKIGTFIVQYLVQQRGPLAISIWIGGFAKSI